jgi:hypothetical protein
MSIDPRTKSSMVIFHLLQEDQGVVVVLVVGVVAEGVGVGATTVKLTGGLVTPYRVAVILLFPSATPVAKPPEPAKDMVATLLLELDQIA